jgi:serine/threonine protein kinase
LEGTRVDHFLLSRKISEGGMGEVYEGTNEKTRERVAIKVLHQDIAKHREVTLRFINEARIMEMLQHPNLVGILHRGELQNGSPYIVMEYLDGVPLTGRLHKNGGRLPMRPSLEICRQVADALTAAHGKGIIHRDLKPDNIMLLADENGRTLVRVFDFGIAKLPPEHMSAEMTAVRTQTGQILGTPAYMAPEQCRSDMKISDKVDVYALGTVLFRCLAGRCPFITEARGDASIMHLCAQQIAEPSPSLRHFAPEIPEILAELVDRTLNKDPAKRPSMKELAAELSRLLLLGIQEESATRKVDPLEPMTVPGGAAEAKTITPSHRKVPKPAPPRRWPYFVGAAVALLWLVLLAIWALK